VVAFIDSLSFRERWLGTLVDAGADAFHLSQPNFWEPVAVGRAARTQTFIFMNKSSLSLIRPMRITTVWSNRAFPLIASKSARGELGCDLAVLSVVGTRAE
jgi:hypothetical protein